MKMKMPRILLALLCFGAAFAGGFCQGEEPAKGSELHKKANDTGKKAGASYYSEAGLPLKALAKKHGVRPGQSRLKPAKPIQLNAEVKKRHDGHAPTIAGPGSGAALAQKPKVELQTAKPVFAFPKGEVRPGQTASAAGSNAVNGTSMGGLRSGRGGGLARLGGTTGSTARGAAAVNGTDVKPKP